MIYFATKERKEHKNVEQASCLFIHVRPEVEVGDE